VVDEQAAIGDVGGDVAGPTLEGCGGGPLLDSLIMSLPNRLKLSVAMSRIWTGMSPLAVIRGARPVALGLKSVKYPTTTGAAWLVGQRVRNSPTRQANLKRESSNHGRISP
jgi:hypothetical protein